MPWIKASDFKPQENEQILIHDSVNNRIEVGRFIGGRWYVENLRDGRLSEIEAVTHWSPALESYLQDDSDDD
jgi:hypothetical protein